jgi:GntR family transcriptional regulator/MocR family aminotransferase
MGNAFHERRQAMELAFQQNDLTVAGQGAFGGSSFWMQAPDGIDTEIVAERLRKKGVLIEPGRPFFTNDDALKNYYRLAYSSLPVQKVTDGVALIAQELHK